jgi:hypothetical protein
LLLNSVCDGVLYLDRLCVSLCYISSPRGAPGYVFMWRYGRESVDYLVAYKAVTVVVVIQCYKSSQINGDPLWNPRQTQSRHACTCIQTHVRCAGPCRAVWGPSGLSADPRYCRGHGVAPFGQKCCAITGYAAQLRGSPCATPVKSPLEARNGFTEWVATIQVSASRWLRHVPARIAQPIKPVRNLAAPVHAGQQAEG